MTATDLLLLHAPRVYDFRCESILYGPVSDLVPSTPVFEMYPIGFTSMAEYLNRHGLRARIINLAGRMLDDPKFDVEQAVRRMDSVAFGIDLHWLPHAHGSIEVARLVKRLHPRQAVIFGGFSSTYFHRELIQYPAVDFILRGDMTEAPLLALVQYLRSGGQLRPAIGSPDYRCLQQIPNLIWKDSEQASVVNPLTYLPDTLDDMLMDYTSVMRSVVRYFDLASHIPFRNWMKYPITAAIAVHGCRYNCVTCGGSACAYRNMHGRTRPVYRSPEKLAQDIHHVGSFSSAPVMVLGDIRQAGEEYTNRFLDAVAGYKKPVFIELFDAPPREFFQRLAKALPNFVVEISMESHDDVVRRAFGRPYTTANMERSMEYALEAGCQRLDLFFMVGLKEQTVDSVMGIVEYSRNLLQRYDRQNERRVIPFISPMAPFLDPGSRAFEEPEKHGYRLFAHTLEEHRQRLLEPSWKYILNYETQWMNRDQIVTSTYESARRLNAVKAEFGVISSEAAQATDRRIAKASTLITEIDQIVAANPDLRVRRERLVELKHRVDDSNLSTVCDKSELEAPVRGLGINFVHAAGLIISDWMRDRLHPGRHHPGGDGKTSDDYPEVKIT